MRAVFLRLHARQCRKVYSVDIDYKSIRASLQQKLTTRSLIVGIGNSARGDDGFGPAVISALKGEAVACMDCGAAPENYLEKMAGASPDAILFIDAIDFGGEAGALRIFDSSRISGGGLSTHALSLQMVFEYLRNRSNARIYLLGMQPAALELGTGLSPAAEQCAGRIAAVIAEVVEHA
jgi:hydrogenase 3 maturation protease